MARKRIVEYAGRTGSAPERLLLTGKINRPQPKADSYPLFQGAAALLRGRGENVIDPSDEARSWTNEVPYKVHVDHSLSLMRDADALVVLPGGMDSRLGTLMMEYALMVVRPILLLGRQGAVVLFPDQPEPPLWTSRLAHRGEGKDVLR